jgi:regulator of protease activity HflC (stomatin/prohibitin superfamily)
MLEERAMSANQAVNQERVVKVWNGGSLLALWIVLLLADAGLLVFSALNQIVWGAVCGVLVLIALMVSLKGFFTLQPNEGRVLVLFGSYKGTVRASGFHWGNPFYTNGQSQMAAQLAGLPAKKLSGFSGATDARGLGRNKISLRARTLNGDTLKVNDKRGNPIEIAAVVVWRVQDTAQAMFDVDDYENYVPTQSESALRHLASLYAYDGDASDITLRTNVDEVSGALRGELQERLGKAGVVVDEARLTHLAYAPEIAQVMLRSQQAEAVISARQKIVHGAVTMVEMALKQLAEKDVVQLDDERRAAMVSNLMVVLCSESEVHPVVNTGTLYH